MIEEVWRPLGVDTEDQIAQYDALHDGVPDWMSAPFWAWVRDAISVRRTYRDGSGNFAMLDTGLAEAMCQVLKVPLGNLRSTHNDPDIGKSQLSGALSALRKHRLPLQIADYLLAHGGHASADDLNAVLTRSKSAYEVGVRSGRPGLTRRVPLGVQVAADSVMARAGRAGVRLAKAWEGCTG